MKVGNELKEAMAQSVLGEPLLDVVNSVEGAVPSGPDVAVVVGQEELVANIGQPDPVMPLDTTASNGGEPEPFVLETIVSNAAPPCCRSCPWLH